MSRIRLVVGLGNPGSKYQNTRHNMGFLVVDEFCRKHSVDLVGDKIAKYKDITFLKPQDYMNLSGQSVKTTARFANIVPEEIFVIHDELDLNFGDIRCKFGGGNAGHNGLKSIQEHLGTGDFYRLRLGIGRTEAMPVASWVLSRFNSEETPVLARCLGKSVEILESFIDKELSLSEIQKKINN